MNRDFITTIEMLRQIRFASDIKMSRNFADFFSDRILQAATEKTLRISHKAWQCKESRSISALT